jgi:hypothetical protein
LDCLEKSVLAVARQAGTEKVPGKAAKEGLNPQKMYIRSREGFD